jgi:hypothetical protein
VLLNVPPPPRFAIEPLNAFWSSHSPLLLTCAPPPKPIRPPSANVLPLQVAVPAMFSTRPPLRSCTLLPLIAMPPLALVVPGPAIVPPAHVVRPATFTVPEPPSVPLVKLSAAIEDRPLSRSDPPWTVVVPPTWVNAFVTVSVPLETVRSALVIAAELMVDVIVA